MPRKGRYSQDRYRSKDSAQIDKIASDLRLEFAIAKQHAPNMLMVLLQAKSKYGLRVKEVPDYKLPVVDAWINCKRKILHLRESVSRSLLLYNNGQVRWILAHELGHLALEHPRSHFHKTKNDFIRPEERTYEAEADKFAIDFLAPLLLAEKISSLSEMKQKFQLPNDIAKRRLQEVEFLRRTGKILTTEPPLPEFGPLEIDLVDIFPTN